MQPDLGFRTGGGIAKRSEELHTVYISGNSKTPKTSTSFTLAIQNGLC